VTYVFNLEWSYFSASDFYSVFRSCFCIISEI